MGCSLIGRAALRIPCRLRRSSLSALGGAAHPRTKHIPDGQVRPGAGRSRRSADAMMGGNNSSFDHLRHLISFLCGPQKASPAGWGAAGCHWLAHRRYHFAALVITLKPGITYCVGLTRMHGNIALLRRRLSFDSRSGFWCSIYGVSTRFVCQGARESSW